LSASKENKLTQDITKNGSSEIAESRDAKEIKKFLRQVPINLADSDWKQVDRFIDAAVENAERDTRERCAQISKEILGELALGIRAVAATFDVESEYQIEQLAFGVKKLRAAAERIRGKE
jgi:hypothetical protein